MKTMDFTVVGIYPDGESFVDHVKAKTAHNAARRSKKDRGTDVDVLAVFDGCHDDRLVEDPNPKQA